MKEYVETIQGHDRWFTNSYEQGTCRKTSSTLQQHHTTTVRAAHPDECSLAICSQWQYNSSISLSQESNTSLNGSRQNSQPLSLRKKSEPLLGRALFVTSESLESSSLIMESNSTTMHSEISTNNQESKTITRHPPSCRPMVKRRLQTDPCQNYQDST